MNIEITSKVDTVCLFTNRAKVVLSFNDRFLEGKLDECISHLNDVYLAIPEQYRSSAEINTDGEEGYEGAVDYLFEIYYWRPATSEEIENKKQIEANRIKHQIERAQAQLDKLKGGC